MCDACAAARRPIASLRARLPAPPGAASRVALVENLTRQPLPSQRPSNAARCGGSASATAASRCSAEPATARSSHRAAQSWSAASSGGRGPREKDHCPEARSARQPVTARPAARHAARCASATARPLAGAAAAAAECTREGACGGGGPVPVPVQGKGEPAPASGEP